MHSVASLITFLPHHVGQYTKKLRDMFGPVALGWHLPAESNTGAMMG